MSRMLLIGSSGQLGAAIARRLSGSAISVPRRTLDLATLTPAIAAAVLDQHEPDAILCVAGATDVERCEREPHWAEAVNTTGPLTLAAAAPGLPFVYLSTDYVFDGVAGPYTEADPPHALSVYGRTKLAAERALLDRHENSLIVRTTGVFGPDPQQKNFLYTLRRVLQSGGTMRVPSDQISNPTDNDDLAAAITALLDINATGLFHAAGPELLSRFEFATRAAHILALDTSNLEAVSTADLKQLARRPLRSGLLTGKLTTTLGRNVFRPLDDAICAFASHLRAPAT